MQVGGGELKLAQKYELWLQMQKERAAAQMVAENAKEQDDQEDKEGRVVQGRKESASKSGGKLGDSAGQTTKPAQQR